MEGKLINDVAVGGRDPSFFLREEEEEEEVFSLQIGFRKIYGDPK